ncbi:Uncharacterised protein [BD1-7 clade bacterium]|uniref:Inner membrane protein YqiJ n=1 Tax=BD1-7 clade bacterium TaxID=2029982 RepID=A0A5S9NTK6_9GAMM|nr:Uncharacterised protein [BD1-7 clade bacterium]CAA0093998.1 Uncharacterised protein [BD1-7 clade bacterium]
MFAIFLHESMDPFYQNISSFPTVLFSFVLILCVLFWLVAVLGFIDIDALDIDLPDSDFDINSENDHLTSPDALAGILMRFGLNGLPFTVIVTFIALFGWLVSYYAVHFLFPYVPSGWMHYLAGLPVLLIALVISILLTAQVIKPLRRFFKHVEQSAEKIVLGRTGVVRSTRVDHAFGEVQVNDNGADLLLRVRAMGDETFKRGDRVVLLEYLAAENLYRVISEKEFRT